MECFFIKDKDAKALQMRSMQHVSRSGEKGERSQTSFAVGVEKTDARIE